FWTQRGETFNDLSCLISRSVVNNNQLVIVIAGEPLLIKTPERPVERLRAIARTNQHADFHPPFSTPFPINDNSSAYSPVWRFPAFSSIESYDLPMTSCGAPEARISPPSKKKARLQRRSTAVIS